MPLTRTPRAATEPHTPRLRMVSGSVVITIPPVIIRTLGWRVGEDVTIQIDRKGLRVVQGEQP